MRKNSSGRRTKKKVRDIPLGKSGPRREEGDFLSPAGLKRDKKKKALVKRNKIF